MDDKYSSLDKILHKLVLGSRNIRQVSFKLETLYTGATQHRYNSSDRPVYICGLARSGTTLLLELLNTLPSMHSQSYQDMPFILSPNLWGHIHRMHPKATNKVERAHGDRLEVDASSPEAFEEVFWSTFIEKSGDSDCYGFEIPSKSLIQKFARFRQCVLASNQTNFDTRYLSKNNNNITRLNALLSEPSARVVFAYRNPRSTAWSLYKKHLRFIELQKRNSFVLEYMSLLGHHEFGMGHRPFCFAKPYQSEGLDPMQPDYWLDYWLAVHQALMSQLQSPQIGLVNHDALRHSPEHHLSSLMAFIGEDSCNAIEMAKQIRSVEAENQQIFDSTLVARTTELYSELCSKTNNI